jgi:hypothetical protein
MTTKGLSIDNISIILAKLSSSWGNLSQLYLMKNLGSLFTKTLFGSSSFYITIGVVFYLQNNEVVFNMPKNNEVVFQILKINLSCARVTLLWVYTNYPDFQVIH